MVNLINGSKCFSFHSPAFAMCTAVFVFLGNVTQSGSVSHYLSPVTINEIQFFSNKNEFYIVLRYTVSKYFVMKLFMKRLEIVFIQQSRVAWHHEYSLSISLKTKSRHKTLNSLDDALIVLPILTIAFFIGGAQTPLHMSTCKQAYICLLFTKYYPWRHIASIIFKISCGRKFFKLMDLWHLKMLREYKLYYSFDRPNDPIEKNK